MSNYLSYFNLDGPDVNRRLQAIKVKIEPFMDGILDRFYETIQQNEDLKAILGNTPVDSLKSAQKNHWFGAMENGLTAEYQNRVNRIGTAHEMIGLNPANYIGAYNIIIGELLALKGKQRGILGSLKDGPLLTNEEIDLLLRMLTYDMANSIMVYQEKSNKIADVLGSSSGFLEQLNGELQQAATSVTEMSSSVRQISDKAQQAQESTADVSRNMASVNQLMNELEGASEKIGSILEIIQDISQRTNLLSLNALIEAARAGEHGRGFSVVADEVKKLANQTNVSAEEIAVEISSIQERIKEISKEVTTVTGAVSGIEDINTDISTAVHEQSTVTDQIEEFVQSVLERATHTQETLQEQARKLIKH